MHGPLPFSTLACRRRLRGAVAWTAFAASLAASPVASAVTTLTVDLSKPIGSATHAANGSLYGVTEMKPADVQGLIAPLHPHMFNSPAADVQQPVGDAIVVAGRVASTGATVTIRLADWFTGWYSFTNMTDWFSKIDQTISRKKAAHLTNIYAYELWNEPNGTWNGTSPNTTSTNGSNLSFNAFWKQTYDHVRAQDPSVKVTGPSVAGYNQSYLSEFLSYCKANDCLPDIVGWHDGGSIQNNVNAYRALEKQLGIGPLPITINEYSLTANITHEGEPGASAALIAAMERTRVDSACITFWDVAHPGRLGSLLATDTQTNGGWFFYEWYGEMTGQMLTTVSSGGGNFDGFANLDPTAGSASVLFGGTSDGALQIVVKGFAAAGAAAAVHGVVERTPWVSRTTVVTATDTLSTTDFTATGDQISVTVPNANATDGFRLLLTWPDGGWVDASAPEAGGAAVDASGDATLRGATGGSEGGTGDATSASGASGSDAAQPGETMSAAGEDAGAALQAGAKSGCSCSSVQSRESSAMGRLAGVLAAVVGLGVVRRRGRKSRGQR
jgi:hypothetical protein